MSFITAWLKNIKPFAHLSKNEPSTVNSNAKAVDYMLSSQVILNKCFKNNTLRLKPGGLYSAQDYLNAIYDKTTDSFKVTIDGAEGVLYWREPVATPSNLPVSSREGTVTVVLNTGDGSTGLYYYSSGAWHQFSSGGGGGLSSDITYYIDPAGSDTTGDGSVAKPFLTVQHALDLLPKNLNGHQATISVNDGTYNLTEPIAVESFFGGVILIVSTHSVPDVVKLKNSSGDAIFISVCGAFVGLMGLSFVGKDNAISTNVSALIIIIDCCVGATTNGINNVGDALVMGLGACVGETEPSVGLYVTMGTVEVAGISVGTSKEIVVDGGIVIDENCFILTPSKAPSSDYEVANKKYVDDNSGGGVWTKVGTSLTPTTTGDKVDIVAMPVGGDWELTKDLTLSGGDVTIGGVHNIGVPVVFERTPSGSETDVLGEGTEIARGATAGIYNIAVESVYERNVSPIGTSWNADGWKDLTNIKNRIYTDWEQSLHSAVGDYIIGAELVMRIDAENRYFKIKFSKWEQGGSGTGGFKYIRQEFSILPIEGTPVDFTHSDGGSEIDSISATVHITRGLTKSIYNAVTETYMTMFSSPENTEWNWDGWADLTDLKTRTYIDFVDCLDGAVGDNVVGAELIMRINSENRYFKVIFSSWTSSSGGGFAYRRTELFPPDCNLLVTGSITTDKAMLASSYKVSTPAYETLVLADNDIPNKKYVDSIAGVVAVAQSIVYVDSERTDIYVADGSMARPFKTIQEAIDTASTASLTCVEICLLKYYANETLDFKSIDMVVLRGHEVNATSAAVVSMTNIVGFVLQNINLTTATLTALGVMKIIQSSFTGALTIQNTFDMADSTVIGDIVLNSATPCRIVNSTISGTITQNDGDLALIDNYITSTSITYTLDSQGGRTYIASCIINNVGGGRAINLDNSTFTPNMLNVLIGLLAYGGIDCNTSPTRVDNVTFLTGTEDITGTALIYSSSNLLKNDSSVSGKTITDALETLAGSSGKSFLTIGTVGSGADYECDGTNDEVEFQNACNAVTATKYEIQVLAGAYVFSASVTLTTKVKLKGVDKSSVSIAYSGSGAFVCGAGSAGTEISNMTLMNNALQLKDATVSDCIFIKANNNTNCTSIELIGDNVIIEGNTFDTCIEIDSGRMQVLWHTASASISNIIFRNNSVGKTTRVYSLIVFHVASPVSNVEITDNEIYCTGDAITMGCSNVRILRNIIDASGATSVNIVPNWRAPYYCSDVWILENTIVGANAIAVTDVKNSMIANNVFSGVTGNYVAINGNPTYPSKYIMICNNESSDVISPTGGITEGTDCDNNMLIGNFNVGTVTLTGANSKNRDSENFVTLTENQTIYGIKTFGSLPVLPSGVPTTDFQTASKKYVDESVAGGVSGNFVTLTGNQSIDGIKSFISFPVSPSGVPSLDFQFANKKYVDDNGGSGVSWWDRISTTLTPKNAGDGISVGAITGAGTTIFNNGFADVDFTINKKTSGTAYVYDAGVDKHTFNSMVWNDGYNTGIFGNRDTLENGFRANAIGDTDTNFIHSINGVDVWDLNTYRTEMGEFWYVSNILANKDILVLSESGRMGINRPTNIMNYHANYVGTLGVGHNDIAVGGIYSGGLQVWYKILIQTDTTKFKWQKSLDNRVTYGALSGSLSVSTSPVAIENGVTVAFDNATGHTTANAWEFIAYPQVPQGTLTVSPMEFDEILTSVDYTLTAHSDYTSELSNSTDNLTTGIPLLVASSLAGAFYMGASSTFRSVYINLRVVANTGCTLIAEYLTNDSDVWASLPITFDGTNSSTGSNSMRQSGVVTWDKPIGWSPHQLAGEGASYNYYWVRLRSSTSAFSTAPTARSITRNNEKILAVFAGSLDYDPSFQVTAMGNSIVGPSNGVSNKLLTVSDVLNPTSMAGGGGLSVIIQNGGGIYMKNNSQGLEGKFEAFSGEIQIGAMTQHPVGVYAGNQQRIYAASAYFQTDALYTTHNSVAIRTSNTGQAVNMGDGFGPLVGFIIQDDAAVKNTIASIGAIRNGADNTGDMVLYTSSAGSNTEKMRIKYNGTLQASTASYETLVLADNDIPNKKYVDSKIPSVLTDEIITAVGPTLSVSGKTYFIDATSNAVGITLPATPTIGMEVGIITLNTTSAITIYRNGSLIEGSATDLSVDVASAFKLKFSNATYGWKFTDK